ncbi:MAG: AAA family ATPase [Nibricoccus sp.]
MNSLTPSLPSCLTNHYLEPKHPTIAAYRNNPLIGALGPVLTGDEITSLLTRRPSYDPSERKLPPHLKAHAIYALRSLVVPTPMHKAIVQEVGVILRQGYVHRNPLSPSYSRMIALDRPALKQGILPPERFRNVPLLGSAAMGTAGTGKTMGFDIAVSTYPQVIDHCYELNGVRVAFKQVTWLKINLFQDASLKAFGIEFFEKLGEAVGENLRRDWGVDACNGNNVQPLIYRACREYNLGLLIVDELQNMVSHSKGYKAVLSYFIRMMNCLGLPIAVIGTNAAGALMQTDAAAARRFISGIPPFRPLASGPLWRGFLEEVWHLQYTKEATTLDETLEKQIHELTGGVPDLVIKLYCLTQTRLFGRKNERLTKGILDETAADLFHTIKDRILELKGRTIDTARIQEQRERLDKQYKELTHKEEVRLGAQPTSWETSTQGPVFVGEENIEESTISDPPPAQNEMIQASRAKDKKAALAKLGILRAQPSE